MDGVKDLEKEHAVDGVKDLEREHGGRKRQKFAFAFTVSGRKGRKKGGEEGSGTYKKENSFSSPRTSLRRLQAV